MKTIAPKWCNQSTLKSELTNSLQTILLKKGQLNTKMLKESWSRKKEMSRKLLKETRSINLLKLSSWHCLAGIEKRRKETLKPIKIMIAKLERISISFLNGTRVEKFSHPTLKILALNAVKFIQFHYLEEGSYREQQYTRDTSNQLVILSSFVYQKQLKEQNKKNNSTLNSWSQSSITFVYIV